MPGKLNYHWDKWVGDNVKYYPIPTPLNGEKIIEYAIPVGKVIKFLSGIEESENERRKEIEFELLGYLDNRFDEAGHMYDCLKIIREEQKKRA